MQSVGGQNGYHATFTPDRHRLASNGAVRILRLAVVKSLVTFHHLDAIYFSSHGWKALHFFLETALHCISASWDANSSPSKDRFTEMRTEQG